MKKILGIILAVMMLATVAFASDITVTLNGAAIDFADQPATIVEGRTLVPLRAIFEALGASVEWDQATKTVTSAMDDTTVKLTIGDNNLYKNGEAVTLDVPAQIINSRTMVPARAIAEAYGVDVQWDSATRTVVLTKEEKVVEEEKVDDSKFFVLTGENFTGNEGFLFTSGTTIVPEIVDDFNDAGNKVLFLHSVYTEKQAWTYFRDNKNVKYQAGERYLVKFRVSTEMTSADDYVDFGSIGICFRYADSAEDGKFKDHGVYNVRSEAGKWSEVYFVFTMPETFIESEGSGFGIFANPVNGLPLSYYLDDVSVSVYNGPAADGIQSPESMKAAEAKESFNIDIAEGMVIDFDDSFNLAASSATEKSVENGNVVLVAADDFNDSYLFLKELSIDASKYGTIAVKFKAENLGNYDNQKNRTFQIYFTTNTQDNLNEKKSASAPYDECLKAGDWYVAYIVMSGNEEWDGTVTSLRFDPANNTGTFTIDKIVILEA